MLSRAILTVACVFLFGCQQTSDEQSKQTGLAHQEQKQQSVFVAHLPVLDKAGNAALLTGVLNEKNGCLYIDDYLVVVAVDNTKWQNKPFWIGGIEGGRFVLGDKVSVGGSQIPFDISYDNSPNKNCMADKIWLVNGISTPLPL